MCVHFCVYLFFRCFCTVYHAYCLAGNKSLLWVFYNGNVSILGGKYLKWTFIIRLCELIAMTDTSPPPPQISYPPLFCTSSPSGCTTSSHVLCAHRHPGLHLIASWLSRPLPPSLSALNPLHVNKNNRCLPRPATPDLKARPPSSSLKLHVLLRQWVFSSVRV